jgi:mannitol/fructose-specific phosphotransferase system IIA component (Ntr-type)
VVDDDERATDGVAAAELLLSRAVVQLSAADIEAVPLIRLDINAPSGILRARKENRATEVLVGWAGRTTKTEFFFGSYMDQLLLDPDYTLVVSRLTQPLNTCLRILWLVPPQADIQVSFRHTLRLVRRISRQLSAKLVVLCAVDSRDRLQKRLRRQKPAVAFSIIALEKWSDVTQTTRRELQPGDTLVLCGNRADAGQNLISFGDFPSRVASRFPENNLLVIYPAESTVESNTPLMRTDITDTADPDSFVIDHVVSDLCTGDMKTAVQCLLSYISEFSGTDPEIEGLTERLAREALELTPGVVIFHAETPLVAKPSVALGISRAGVAWSGSDNAAFLFVMLLDPPGRDATRHLQNLAAVARLFHSPDTIALLREATDSKDVLEKLKQI